MRLTAKVKAQILESLKAVFDAIQDDHSCQACDHFDASQGYCHEWKQEVPQETQPSGCDRWRDEGVPF